MFAFMGSVMMEEFRKYQPELLKIMKDIISKDKPITVDEYKRLPDISIDYAIMEKTDKGVVLPSDFGWSDIGSWKSLYDFLPKDKDNNIIDGDVIAKDTKNCFIMSRDRLIAANHLNKIVVVETPDAVFVSDIDNSRDVKSIVNQLKGKEEKNIRTIIQFVIPGGVLLFLNMKMMLKLKDLSYILIQIFSLKLTVRFYNI